MFCEPANLRLETPRGEIESPLRGAERRLREGLFPCLERLSRFTEPRHLEITYFSPLRTMEIAIQLALVCSTIVGRSVKNTSPHAAPILITLPRETSPLGERCRGSLDSY